MSIEIERDPPLSLRRQQRDRFERAARFLGQLFTLLIDQERRVIGCRSTCADQPEPGPQGSRQNGWIIDEENPVQVGQVDRGAKKRVGPRDGRRSLEQRQESVNQSAELSAPL